MGWKFVGDGTLLGVPARDLTDEEYAKYAPEFEAREGVALESTGFYQPEKKATTKPVAAASEGE